MRAAKEKQTERLMKIQPKVIADIRMKRLRFSAETIAMMSTPKDNDYSLDFTLLSSIVDLSVSR